MSGDTTKKRSKRKSAKKAPAYGPSRESAFVEVYKPSDPDKAEVVRWIAGLPAEELRLLLVLLESDMQPPPVDCPWCREERRRPSAAAGAPYLPPGYDEIPF